MTTKQYNDVCMNILSLLYSSPEGLTWKELQIVLKDTFGTKAHHGTISGALSKMHKNLDIFRLKTKRDNCYLYVHSAFRQMYKDDVRTDYPKNKNKWRDVADLLYFVMTAENIPADAWENALKAYRDLNHE